MSAVEQHERPQALEGGRSLPTMADGGVRAVPLQADGKTEGR